MRAYLLKPLVDRCSIELGEIRPADQEVTDLDVRLTLVGTDECDDDEDFMLGDDGDGDGDFSASRDLSDDFMQGQGVLLDAHEGAPDADDTRRRRPSLAHRPSMVGSAGAAAATEQCALRNIEQSLQILVDAMPMAAMRAAAVSSVSSAVSSACPLIPPPVSKDLFDIAVERAEESLLETIAAHKSVLGLTSLYKCFTMVECVELFGELSAPTTHNLAAPSSGGTACDIDGDASPLDSAALSAALDSLTAANANASARQANSPLRRQLSNGSLKLSRGLSNSSLLSLMSDNSYATVPGSPQVSTPVGNSSSSSSRRHHSYVGNLAASLMRYPAFSAHLHKTLLGLLEEAIKTQQEGAGKGKFHFDVSRGEITHLPAPVLQRLSRELPLRRKCLSAFEIFVEIGAATDKLKEESLRSNAGFSALQALNLRQLFERSASVTSAASVIPPGQSHQSPSVLSGSIFNSMTLSSSASGAVTAAMASSPLVHLPLNDDIANLCKQNTTRAEAAMWALRAAQNMELEQSRQVAQNPRGAVERDRIASADSGISGSSHTLFRPSTAGIHQKQSAAVGVVVRSSLTPTTSMDNVTAAMPGGQGNSHSKVTRISGGGSAVGTKGGSIDTSPATPPLLSTDRTDSTASSYLLPFFPTEYSKRTTTSGGGHGSGMRNSGGSSRGGSSTGSGTGSEGRLLVDSSVELDFSSVSFSAFRAFHLALESAAKMDREWSSDKELYDACSDSFLDSERDIIGGGGGGGGGAPLKFRTAQLLRYLLDTDDLLRHNGRLGHVCELINSAAPWVVAATGAGFTHHNHSSSNLSLNLSALRSPGVSLPAGPASPRQGLPVAISAMPFALPALMLPSSGSSSGAAAVVDNETVGTIAAAILRSLANRSMRIETTFVTSATTETSTTASRGRGTGNTKSAAAEFTMAWAPCVVTPQALSSFLTAPLTGDIFSLNNFNVALKLLGLPNKLTGLKHLAPLFCSHLAKQSPQYLVTDVLTRKLSTFPFQRWLRDSLLTFQDALASMEQQRAACKDRTPSIALPGTSVTSTTSTDSVRTSLILGRAPISASGERDAREARDVSQILTRTQTESVDKAPYKLRAPGGSGSYDEEAVTDDFTEDVDTIMQLADEIYFCRERSGSSGGASGVGGGDGVSDGVNGVSAPEGAASPGWRSRKWSYDQASLLSSADPLPSYNEYIRYSSFIYCCLICKIANYFYFCAIPRGWNCPAISLTTTFILSNIGIYFFVFLILGTFCVQRGCMPPNAATWRRCWPSARWCWRRYRW